MFNMNWFLSRIQKGQNPEQIMMDLLESKMKGTPLGDNLINLAKKGDYAEIEKIARNLVSERGMDFDKEFNNFKSQLGLL